MGDIYNHLALIIKNKLVKDLKNDEEFKNLNIDNLIEQRVDIITSQEINLKFDISKMKLFKKKVIYNNIE